MHTLHHILSLSVLNNTLMSYSVSVGTFFGLSLIMGIIRFVFLKRLRVIAARTETDLDDFLISQFRKNMIPLLYYGVFFASTRNLNLHPKVDKTFFVIGIILVSFYGVRVLSAAIQHALEKYLRGNQSDEDYVRTMKGLFPIINILLWSVGMIFLLDNLGFNISAVVAGLGIGGIAVALAAQAVLGDLFSYFAILLDKPFEHGDTLNVGGFIGAIERIGIKTTKMRSVSGEVVIFSNSDLTKSRVQNFRKMQERRIAFKINVTYDTPKEKLEMIPDEVKKIISAISNVRFDRAHLSQLGDWAITFEVVYYVLLSDYNLYMDVQQTINLALLDLFEKEKIMFAYPTQSVMLIKEPGNV